MNAKTIRVFTNTGHSYKYPESDTFLKTYYFQSFNIHIHLYKYSYIYSYKNKYTPTFFVTVFVSSLKCNILKHMLCIMPSFCNGVLVWWTMPFEFQCGNIILTSTRFRTRIDKASRGSAAAAHKFNNSTTWISWLAYKILFLSSADYTYTTIQK